MSFINVTILERAEGTPGVIKAQAYDIMINTDNIVLFNGGEKETDSENFTFVRIVCGATITVAMSYEDFIEKLSSNGNEVELVAKRVIKKNNKKGK